MKSKLNIIFIIFAMLLNLILIACSNSNNSGKTIIPFCAHGTGGLSRTVRDIRRTIPNVKVLDAIGVYRPEVRNSKNRIVNWVKGLNY